MWLRLFALLTLLTIGKIGAANIRPRTLDSACNTGVPPTVAPTAGCGCNHTSLWLDVMLVLDSSTSMTLAGLQAFMSYMGSAILSTVIGQGPGQKMRLGVITYSDDANLQYGLTSFSNSMDFLQIINKIPYENLPGSNIEAGIRLAMEEFDKNGLGDYVNRRKVIIVAASHYESGRWTDPEQIATTFKGDNGFLITIEYVQAHGAPVAILEDLASPCAKLSNLDPTFDTVQLLDTFCTANCFCTKNWAPYTLESQCQTPDAGCYWPVTVPAAFPLAQIFCTEQNGAVLPSICEPGKAIFISSLLSSHGAAQWIGLSRQNNGSFVWDDGTEYGSCQPAQNPSWRNGTFAQPGQAVAQVIPNGFQAQFFGDNPVQDYVYACQNTPCSSTFYCA